MPLPPPDLSLHSTKWWTLQTASGKDGGRRAANTLCPSFFPSPFMLNPTAERPWLCGNTTSIEYSGKISLGFFFFHPGFLLGSEEPVTGKKREDDGRVWGKNQMPSAWSWATLSWEPNTHWYCRGKSWGLFGNCSMNFQSRTINAQLWVWPLLLFFAKLNIQGPAEYHSLSLLQLLGTCCLRKWLHPSTNWRIMREH